MGTRCEVCTFGSQPVPVTVPQTRMPDRTVGRNSGLIGNEDNITLRIPSHEGINGEWLPITTGLWMSHTAIGYRAGIIPSWTRLIWDTQIRLIKPLK